MKTKVDLRNGGSREEHDVSEQFYHGLHRKQDIFV
jgi:hypothetical protein